MKIKPEDVRRMSASFDRLVNKYNRLSAIALDFGTGDFLYSSELHIIDSIGKNEGNTVNEICNKFEITKGAVSQTVLKLYRKGVVHKKRNPDYHKEIILSLTARGKNIFEFHESFHRQINVELYKLMQDLTCKDIKIFEKIMLKIEKYIEKLHQSQQ